MKMSSEETEDEMVWIEYTERHKCRLANKQSLCEFQRVLKKVAQNRNNSLASGDNSDMNFSCISNIGTDNIVALEDSYNIINIQVLTEEYESINDDICDIYNRREEFEIPSDNNIDFEVASNTPYELEENDFHSEIKEWAADYKICLNALTRLLRILRKRCNITFPKDGRTLLETARTTNVISMDKGFYCHFGVEPAIHNMIEDRISSTIDNIRINLIICTDGAPISVSSGKVIWPIMCSDKLLRIIGIYCGQNKPADSNIFLKAFVNELIPLINNGVVHNGISYKIRLHALVCDAPAKAFILKVKNHTGYNSCTKCLIHGDRIDDTTCFPMESKHPLRDDETFRQFGYCDNYQIDKTILINIPSFGAVTNVPLDYMHLVCLGVMKKLLLLWIKGPLKTRLSAFNVQRISEKLLTLKKYIPSDFPRKARSLQFIALWKATEYRQFLLYSGPVILKNILSKNVYEHFLMLYIAIRILASTEYSKNFQLLEYAEKLLNIFVESFSKIYGAKYVSHNVHNLLHLTCDVKQFGALDGFSAFQFESYICTLKKLVRKGDKPLEQIYKRLKELNFNVNRSEVYSKTILEKDHTDGPLTDERNYTKQYKILHLGSFHLNCNDHKNHCVILKDNTIVCALNIAKGQNNNLYIIGKKMIPHRNLFCIPCHSQHLGIVITKQNMCIESWLCKNICAKAYKIPYENKFIIIPILHTLVSTH